MSPANRYELCQLVSSQPAFTAVGSEPYTGMGATPMVSRYPAGSTSTAYSSGLQSDRQDGDSEVAAGPLRGIALLSKGIVITVGLIMPLIRWLCAVRVDG